MCENDRTVNASSVVQYSIVGRSVCSHAKVYDLVQYSISYMSFRLAMVRKSSSFANDRFVGSTTRMRVGHAGRYSRAFCNMHWCRRTVNHSTARYSRFSCSVSLQRTYTWSSPKASIAPSLLKIFTSRFFHSSLARSLAFP